MAFTYLASPYTHTDPEIVRRRYTANLEATHVLLSRKVIVFSPIVHCHMLAQEFDMPDDFNFWKRYDTAMLAASSMLLILRLDGWQDSVGVAAEQRMAEDFSIMVREVSPHALGIKDVPLNEDAHAGSPLS